MNHTTSFWVGRGRRRGAVRKCAALSLAVVLALGVGGCGFVAGVGERGFEAAESTVELGGQASARADDLTAAAATARLDSFERRIDGFGEVADSAQAAVFAAWEQHESRVARAVDWLCARQVGGQFRLGGARVVCDGGGGGAPEGLGAGGEESWR